MAPGCWTLAAAILSLAASAVADDGLLVSSNGSSSSSSSSSSSHVPVWRLTWPLDPEGVVTLGLAAGATGLAAGAGIGGGGILVPIFILRGHLTTTTATTLSLATITGGSAANVLLFCGQKRVLAGAPARPLIDYSTVTLLTPPLLAGTIMGAILNTVVPPWLLLGLLLLVLGAASLRSVQKACTALGTPGGTGMYGAGTVAPDSETAEDEFEMEMWSPPEQMTNGGLGEPDQAARLLGPTSDSGSEGDDQAYLDGLDDDERAEMLPILDAESKQCPSWLIFETALLWLVVVSSSLMRRDMVACGSFEDMALLAATLILLACFTRAVAVRLTAAHAVKQRVGYRSNAKGTMINADDDGGMSSGASPVGGGDLVWSQSMLFGVCVWCVLAGTLAGMLGIGGGMVLVPLLLELDAAPLTAAATSSLMVFVTASAGLTQVLLHAALAPLDLTMFVIVVGFVSTLFGHCAMDVCIRRFGHGVIVAVVALTLVLATVLLGLVSLGKVRNAAASHQFGFRGMCATAHAYID